MSLTLNGKTFAELGLSAATYKESISGDTSLDITADQALTDPPLFPAFSQVTLKDGAATVFVGWLDNYPKQATPNSRSRTYSFTGPNRWLNFSFYQEPFVVVGPDGDHPTINVGPSGLAMHGRAIESDGTQIHIPLDVALQNILDYAIGDVGNFTYEIQTPNPLGVYIPWAARQDDSCLNALRTLLKWAPETALRWEGTKLIIFTPDTTDLAHAKIFSQQTLPLKGTARLTPMLNMLCSETKIIYLKRHDAVGAASGIANQYTMGADVATGGYGTAVNAPQKAVITIYLEEGEDPPDPGVAQLFQNWAGKLQFKGEATVDGLDWSNRDGDVWQPGGLFDFDGNTAVCQSITRDLFRLSETISFGLPLHLNLSDFVALRRKLGRRPDTGGGGSGSQTGSLTVNIKDHDGVTIDEATWNAGGKSAASGASLSFPAGSQTIGVSLPPDYSQPTPKTQDVVIVAGGVQTIDFNCENRTRIHLKADNSNPLAEIIIDTQAFVDLALPDGHTKAQFQEVDILVDGALKKTVVCIVDPYTRDE